MNWSWQAVLRERGVAWVETASPAAQAQGLAETVAAALSDALASRGEARMALSGGRSPIPFLQALACHVLDWEQVKLTLVDERWVSSISLRATSGCCAAICSRSLIGCTGSPCIRA